VSTKSKINPMPSGEKANNNEHFCFGWLKNGNPTGNYLSAPRCSAKTKRTGSPCGQPAMMNGKCRLHGGLSTGPKTPEGLAHSQKANWKHGFYSADARQEARTVQQAFKAMRTLLKEMK